MPATSDGWDATDGREYVSWRKTWVSNPLLDDESQAALRRVVSPEIRGVEVVEEALPARVKPWLIKNKAVVHESREEESQSRQRLIDEIDRMFSDDQSDPLPPPAAQPSPTNLVPDSPLMSVTSTLSAPPSSSKKSADMANVEVHILSDSDDDLGIQVPPRVRNVPQPPDESLLPELHKLKPSESPPVVQPKITSPKEAPPAEVPRWDAPPAPEPPAWHIPQPEPPFHPEPAQKVPYQAPAAAPQQQASEPPYKVPPKQDPDDTALRWLEAIRSDVFPSILMGLTQYRKVRDKLRSLLLRNALQQTGTSAEALCAAEEMLHTLNAAYQGCMQDRIGEEAAALLRDPQLSPIVVDNEAMFDGPEPVPPPVPAAAPSQTEGPPPAGGGADEETPARSKRQRTTAAEASKRRKTKRAARAPAEGPPAAQAGVSASSSVNTSPLPPKATSAEVEHESTAASAPAEPTPEPPATTSAEAPKSAEVPTPAEVPTSAEAPTTFCKTHGETSRSSMGGCSECDSALITRMAKRGLLLLRTKTTARGRAFELKCTQNHVEVYHVIPAECWQCGRLRRQAEEKARSVAEERRREQAQQRMQQKLFETAQRYQKVAYPDVDPTGSRTIEMLIQCGKSRLPSWDILNVRKPTAPAQKPAALNEAKIMYKTLVMRVHPDKCQHPLSQEAFHVLDTAWKSIQKSCQLH